MLFDSGPAGIFKEQADKLEKKLLAYVEESTQFTLYNMDPDYYRIQLTTNQGCEIVSIQMVENSTGKTKVIIKSECVLKHIVYWGENIKNIDLLEEALREP